MVIPGVEPFLSIIDRLIQLKQHRDTNLQSVFEKLLEPIFGETLQVHKDYVEMFQEVLAALGAARRGAFDSYRIQGPPEEVPLATVVSVAERLRQRRIDFEPVRRKLAGLATAMNDLNLSQEVLDFVRAFQNYFPTGLAESCGTESQFLLGGLDRWINSSSNEHPSGEWIDPQDGARRAPVEFILNSVTLTLSRLRNRWAVFCETYATLRVKVYTHN